jgi:hypothetical protein
MLVITFTGIVGFILYPVLRWKWSFSSAPFFGIFTIISFLYIFGLFNSLLFGFYFIFVCSIILTILAIYLTRKEFKWVFAQIFSPSFIIFLFMFTLLGYLSRSWLFSEWDEYSHWGIFAKAMYFENKFPAQVDFVIIWPHYPPGMTIFQYYVTKLAGYSERAVFFAQNIVVLSAAVATLGAINWKKSYLAIGSIYFCYWSIYFWGYRINTLYMDGILGVVFGASIVAYYGDEKRDWTAVLKIAPVLFVLPLIKQLGIVFALIIVGIIIFDRIIIKGDLNDGIKGFLNKNGYSRLLWTTMTFAIPLLSSFSWTIFLRFWRVKGFPINIQLGTLLNAFSLWATDAQRNVIFVFMENYQNTKIGFAPYGCVGIVITLIVLTLTFAVFRSDTDFKRGVYFQLILFFGFLFYSVILLAVYIAVNDPQLQSYARYMGTYCLGWSYLIYGMFYSELKNDVFDGALKNPRNAGVTLLFSFLLLAVFALTPLSSMFTPPAPFTPRIEINKRIEKFIPYMKENSRVWIIWQNTSGLEFHITRYLIAPRMVNGFNQSYKWSLGEPYYEGDVWTYNITQKEWRAEIDNKKYDYILIGRADDKFWQMYGELFCGGDTISNSQLFKVELNCFTAIKP